MFKVAIVTDDPGWHGARLRQALTARGCESQYVSLTECGFEISAQSWPIRMPGFSEPPDAVFVRGVPGGSLEQVTHYLAVLHALRHLGIPVYNEACAIERTVDKSMTSFLLAQAGIPTPRTWVVGKREQALAIAETALGNGQRLVSKPLFGSQGEGLRRYDSAYDLLRLSDSNGIYYLQEFVDSPGSSHDYRVFVVAGRAVAAMRRSGLTWVNNVAQGARCEPVAVHGTLQVLAERAVAALRINYAGVDLIADTDGRLHVIEVNSVPAWRGLQSVTGIEIAEHLVDDMLGFCRPNEYALQGAC